MNYQLNLTGDFPAMINFAHERNNYEKAQTWISVNILIHADIGWEYSGTSHCFQYSQTKLSPETLQKKA